PSFEGQANTIEYNKDFSIKVSGLLPNSTIDNISGSKGVKAKKDSYDVNDKGEATIEFEGISDYNILSVKINFTYIKRGNEEDSCDTNEIKIAPFDLIFYYDNYLNPYNGKDVNLEVSKGLQNRKLIWSISGDGEFKNTPPEYFDSTGKIKIQITPKKPYQNSVKVSVKYEGESKDFSQIIRYDYKPEIPSANDSKVDFNNDTSLKLTGLKPNSKVTLIPNMALTYTKLYSTETTANENGIAYIYFSHVSAVPIVDYDKNYRFYLTIQYDRGDGEINSVNSHWIYIITKRINFTFWAYTKGNYYKVATTSSGGVPGMPIPRQYIYLSWRAGMGREECLVDDTEFDKKGEAKYYKDFYWNTASINHTTDMEYGYQHNNHSSLDIKEPIDFDAYNLNEEGWKILKTFYYDTGD
ncbi:hypothetical protein, partial [Campylobacter peloridis]|uniref:hypothetical protein n=1 Tax=Campylobacter peloridis TaxID=488546 RepID=UPI001C73C67A